MNEFYFLQFVASELTSTLDDLTGAVNILVKEVHIEPGKTIIKYELLTEDGFQLKEIDFPNNIKK